MTDDNVEHLIVEYDDHLDYLVDKVNYLLQDYGLVFENDEEKNDESCDNGDGRMWYVLKELKNEN